MMAHLRISPLGVNPRPSTVAHCAALVDLKLKQPTNQPKDVTLRSTDRDQCYFTFRAQMRIEFTDRPQDNTFTVSTPASSLIVVI